MSDERRLKPQKRAGVSGTKLNSAAQRCAHTLSGRKARVHRATCCRCEYPADEGLRPPSQSSGGFHGGLRPVAAVRGAEAAAAADGVGCVAAAFSDCAAMQQVVRRCNGLRCECNRQRCDAKTRKCFIYPRRKPCHRVEFRQLLTETVAEMKVGKRRALRPLLAPSERLAGGRCRGGFASYHSTPGEPVAPTASS